MFCFSCLLARAPQIMDAWQLKVDTHVYGDYSIYQRYFTSFKHKETIFLFPIYKHSPSLT